MKRPLCCFSDPVDATSISGGCSGSVPFPVSEYAPFQVET
jgi:hypothetical protein